MSQSSSAAKSHKSINWISPLKRLITDPYAFRLTLLCVIFPGTLLAIVWYAAETLVSGVEFNPQTFTFRKFSFQRDPLTNTQLTSIKHETISAVANIPNHYWDTRRQVSLQSANRWDLVSIATGWDQSAEDGPAKILVHYLRSSTPSKSSFWDEYAQKEPKKSSDLWLAVHYLVEFGFYSELPPVFELAFDTGSLDDFRSKMTSLMFEILLRKATSLEKSGDVARACLVAEVGLKYRNDEQFTAILDRHSKK